MTLRNNIKKRTMKIDADHNKEEPEERDHNETAALSAEILDSDNVGEVEDGEEIGEMLSEYGWEAAL